MATKVVIRTTQFKLAPEHHAGLSKLYSTMRQDAKKDGKPYIISNAFGPTVADPRSLGYTYVAQTVFRDRADFAYYDERCEAHARLKAWLAGKVEGKPMMTFFEAVPVTGSGQDGGEARL